MMYKRWSPRPFSVSYANSINSQRNRVRFLRALETKQIVVQSTSQWQALQGRPIEAVLTMLNIEFGSRLAVLFIVHCGTLAEKLGSYAALLATALST